MPVIGSITPQLLAVAAFAVVAVFAASSSSASAGTFAPTTRACIDNSTTIDTDAFQPGQPQECDGDTSPGAPSGVAFEYNVAAPDVMHEDLIFFVPADWGIPTDADITNGTEVGRAILNLTLAIGQTGACDYRGPFAFVMRDAATSHADLVTFDEQDDLNGPFPRGVNEYPEYLLTTWSAAPDNPATALQPLARYFARPNVPLVVQLTLNIGVFAPGTTYRGIPLDPDLGYPIIVTPQISGQFDQHPEPRPVIAECSPYGINMTIRNGTWSNPPVAGRHSFTTYLSSQPDADGDGHENGLDSCPNLPNPGWDPRDSAQPLQGDADSDGIPDTCDPLPADPNNPIGGALGDHDGDYYSNHQDNCPVVSNGIPLAGSPNDQADTDNDDIGDSCDPNPTTFDGSTATACQVSIVQIGDGGPPAANPASEAPCTPATTTFTCAACGDTDADTILDAFDNCPAVPNPAQADSDADAIGDACEAIGGAVEIPIQQQRIVYTGILAVAAIALALIASIRTIRR